MLIFWNLIQISFYYIIFLLYNIILHLNSKIIIVYKKILVYIISTFQLKFYTIQCKQYII